MRIVFRATEGSFGDDGFALICGLSGTDDAGAVHYLNLQRGPKEEPVEDGGVHIEFDDQINSRYNLVRECRLGRVRLSVDLAGQLGALAGVEGFDIDLDLDDESLGQIKGGIPRVFRGMNGMLVIAETNT